MLFAHRADVLDVRERHRQKRAGRVVAADDAALHRCAGGGGARQRDGFRDHRIVARVFSSTDDEAAVAERAYALLQAEISHARAILEFQRAGFDPVVQRIVGRITHALMRHRLVVEQRDDHAVVHVERLQHFRRARGHAGCEIFRKIIAEAGRIRCRVAGPRVEH